MGEEPSADHEWHLLAAAAGRVARARGADAHTADDVAQETVSRLLAVTDRLEPAARLPYALTTAGNLVVSLRRAADRDRRHRHRLVDLDRPVDPESAALALEQAAAVRAALDALDPKDRLLFVDHVEGATTSELAAAHNSTPAAIVARLARTRARLRLEYVLGLRGVDLPTRQCRRVLLAVSAADIRRQRALNVGAHLADCPTCASLIPPLVQRRSALAGITLAPLVALGRFGGRIGRSARSHLVQVTAGVAVAVAGGVYAVSATHHQTSVTRRTALPAIRSAVPAVSPQTISIRTARGVGLLPVPAPAALTTFVGQDVIVSDVPVQSVVSHPGFWIGSPGSQRLYVHLNNAQLARQRIRVGRHVSFVAVLQRNAFGFPASDGVNLREGAALLARQGVHLTVDARKVIQT